MDVSTALGQLLNTLPQVGKVMWIGARPARDEPMIVVESAQLVAGRGLVGDRFKGRPGSARQVTLIQHEHLAVLAACLHRDSIDPMLLRRNISVGGINLLALKDKRFRVGETLLEYSGLAHPCSKMETLLGAGGYNAMRVHGGITARVIDGGVIHRGDAVVYLSQDEHR